MLVRLAFLTVTLTLGCQRGNASAPVEARSGEGESCTSSADCEPALRCVEDVCRTQVDVPLGDYHWAAGNALRDKGDAVGAEESYRLALAAFESKKVVPPELLCDYGAAIRGRKNDRAVVERSARLLHGCFNGALPGSTLRRRAAAELAELAPLGLDPAVLARDVSTEGYLTRTAAPTAAAPAARPVGDVVVDIQANADLRGKGPQAAVTLLASGTSRALVGACMGDFVNATGKSSLSLPVSVVFRARYDDFDEEYVGGRLEVDPPDDLEGAEAIAARCVSRALAEQAANFGSKPRGPSFKGTLLVKLSLEAKPE